MTHEQLPDTILGEYRDLTLDDLKQSCLGHFYHYTTKKYGIVGGYDFGFFIYTRYPRKKVYFDGVQGI